MRHLYQCPLRWADLDLLGHVNNVTYVDYLQEARVDLFRTHAPGQSAPDDLAEGVVVVRHEVTYVSPLTFRSGRHHRVLGHRDPRRQLHHGLRDLRRGRAGERTVYLRAAPC